MQLFVKGWLKLSSAITLSEDNKKRGRNGGISCRNCYTLRRKAYCGFFSLPYTAKLELNKLERNLFEKKG